MDKFIKQLLQLYSKVILPDFGAITISDEDTGELMFQQYLTFDDGKLTDLLVKESNMDVQEAKNSIAKFVRNLKSQLDKGESYSIYQLGEFSKNESGDYVFVGNLVSGNHKSEDKEPEIITKIKADIEKEDKKTKEDVSKKSEITTEESQSDTPDSTKEKSADKKLKTSKKKVEEKEVKKENVYIKPEKEEKKKEDSKKVVDATKEEVKPVTSEKEKVRKTQKQNPVFWILLLIIFLIIGGIIYAFLKPNEFEKYMGFSIFDTEVNKTIEEFSKVTEESEIIDAEITESADDEVHLDEDLVDLPSEESDYTEDDYADAAPEEVIENVDITEKPEIQASNFDSQNKYHVIVGVFSEEANADKKVREESEKGLNCKMIGKYNGLYYVSGGSYATQQEALNNLNKINEVSKGAWIYKSK
ncbi:MAG: SPOR domain-containing protein [Brumimicrobium sp.]